MKSMILEIHQALHWGFHYLAVMNTLVLPDICGALESENGWATKDKFLNWSTTWFIPKYARYLTSEDLYKLRCGVIHQGRMGPAGMQYDRVVFLIEQNIHCFTSSNNSGTTESALMLNPHTFCRDMTSSVSDWLLAKRNDPNVLSNLPNLLQFRRNGIAPHIGGTPVIA